MMSTTPRVTKAEPFPDFWGLRSAIVYSKEKPRPHRSSRKHKESPTSDASTSWASGNPVLTRPNRRNVLVAKAATGSIRQKTAMQYGTPVPGKRGLVVSPFAPDSGYVDVTGFSPGSEVEDPYTGRVFLTP